MPNGRDNDELFAVLLDGEFLGLEEPSMRLLRLVYGDGRYEVRRVIDEALADWSTERGVKLEGIRGRDSIWAVRDDPEGIEMVKRRVQWWLHFHMGGQPPPKPEDE